MSGVPASDRGLLRVAAAAPATHAGFPDIDVNPPVSIADSHVLDIDLLSPTPSGRKHMDECGWCQQRQQVADRHRDNLAEEEFLRAARQRAEAGGVRALSALTRLTPQLQALTGDADVRDDVAVGQLWRLRWQDATELALVVAIDRWWVTVAPVTTDINAADEFSVLLPPTASVLGTAFAACFSLECTVPMFVFDRLITHVSRPTLDVAQAAAQLPPPDSVRDVWRAWRRDTDAPPQLAYGAPLEDGDLDRRELRAAIATSFAVLVGSSACLPGDPQSQVLPIAEQVRTLGLKPVQLVEKTGLPREVFMRIVQGGRVLRDEAPLLARLLDTDTQTVLNANPPLDDDLIIEVSLPRHRGALRRLAQAGSSEDTERWLMADSVAPLAARTVTPPTADSSMAPRTRWAAKVDVYLQSRLADLDKSS